MRGKYDTYDAVPRGSASEVLERSEAAELLRVSPRTVYGWVSQGVIPHRKAGRRLIFLESELIDFTKPDLRRHQY